ncbi:MAG TPA: hypothetical protein VGC90_00120, partial [Candidatus Limnocylindrales bacterium]
ILALDGRPGPAAFVGAAAAAFAGGLWLSDSVARRRPAGAVVAGDDAFVPIRWPVVVALGVLGVLAIVPALIQTGIPFLVRDITASRAELGGLSVQLLRVALPGAAAIALLSGVDAPPRTRSLAAIAIVAIAAFETLLASRYLLAELGATLVIAWLLAGRRIRRDIAAAALVVALIAFAGIQVLRAYDNAAGNSAEFAANRTVNRIVLVQPRTIAALMDAIPARQGYFLGLTWLRRLGPLVGRPDIPNLGYWIYPDVVPGDQATAGYAAPGWLGEAWANFGWAGIALFAALGVAVERLGALVAWRVRLPGGPRRTVDIAAAALAILFVARTHALGVLGLAVLLVLVAAWRLLAAPPVGLVGDVRRTLAWRT